MEKKAFLQFVKEHLEGVFDFSYRITNSQKSAEEIVLKTFCRAFIGQDKISLRNFSKMRSWLFRIVVNIANDEIEESHLDFDRLDDIIRSDPTQVTTTSQLTDPERHHLLWELQQGCMTAVLNCLSPGERLAFTLCSVMGLSATQGARVLEITEAAFKVRFSRATKKISSYLAPRCGHINPNNPCHCPSRLGVAIKKGFVHSVPGAKLKLRKVSQRPFDDHSTHHDVVSLYENLPSPEPPKTLLRTITNELEKGEWQALRDKKLKQKKPPKTL